MDHGHGGDIYTEEVQIDFSANINPLGPTDHLLQAMAASLNQTGHYPDVHCRKLRDAIAAHEQVEAQQIICGNGAADLIYSLVLAERPKQALLISPSFSEYEQALKTVDCRIAYHQLEETQFYQVTERYLEVLHKDLDMIFLCIPNNPTGALIAPELLEKIVRQCLIYNIRLVVDECFLEFLDEHEKYSMKRFLKKREIFILKAFTKMYAMPGIRLGYAITSDQCLLKRIQGVRQPWSVSVTAQAGGIAALNEPDFVSKSRAYIERERSYLCAELARLGIRYLKPEANYICFKSRADLRKLLMEKGILIRDCSNYRGMNPGYFRIAVKRHEENTILIRALERVSLEHN